jgi:PTS system N-acetylgalactosamine-specific IIA component
MKMEDVEQMNYAMAIVGHGRYPEGVLSALKLLIGTTEGMTAFNLDENTTHERFEQCLNDFLKENKHAIIFADMTGGAPHQIVSRLIIEKNQPHQYIISSAPLNLILDLYAKNMSGFEDNAIEETLRHTVELSKQLIEILPDRMKTNSTKVPIPNAAPDEEDGI